jgi:hypothetical protein
MTGTPIQLPNELRDFIREELGNRAIETYEELGRGCWVFARNNTASFVAVANIGTIYGKNYPEQTALLLLMIAEYDPAQQAVVIVSLKKGQQILTMVNIS